MTDSLTLIHFPPGGKHTAQTVLDSCSLLSNFLILPTHLTPHILRPLTAWMNYTSETLSDSFALCYCCVRTRKKENKSRREFKMENSGLHTCSRAFCSLCGLVAARAPPIGRQQHPAFHVGASLPHMARVSMATEKSFCAGHGNVFRSERNTSQNKNQAAERFKLLPSLSQKVQITRLASANSGDADLECEQLKQTSMVHRDLRLLICQQALFLSEKVCLSELISVLA